MFERSEKTKRSMLYFERLTDPFWFGLGQAGGASPDAISAVGVNGVVQR